MPSAFEAADPLNSVLSESLAWNQLNGPTILLLVLEVWRVAFGVSGSLGTTSMPEYIPHGWLSKLWSLFGYPKY